MRGLPAWSPEALELLRWLAGGVYEYEMKNIGDAKFFMVKMFKDIATFMEALNNLEPFDAQREFTEYAVRYYAVHIKWKEPMIPPPERPKFVRNDVLREKFGEIGRCHLRKDAQYLQNLNYTGKIGLDFCEGVPGQDNNHSESSGQVPSPHECPYSSSHGHDNCPRTRYLRNEEEDPVLFHNPA
ncbi:hypothetical protein NHQ30_005704 [Ciborinia camelliae]|nr:hypothetical protein NHQ30_005704 [Ciborinia camelliae]